MLSKRRQMARSAGLYVKEGAANVQR